MMSGTNVVALQIANEAFLIASTIERCPKTMMLRELVMNALEAAVRISPGAQVVDVGMVEIDGVPKLRIWNSGPGMTMRELHDVCDLASSLHKSQTLDGNFGMGAKVASLPSNRIGVRYRSCQAGIVSQVTLGQRQGIYGRLIQELPADDALLGVYDVTASCLDDPRYDLGRDWTEVVLFGNKVDQNTVRDPYAGDPAMEPDWVAVSLLRRFYRVPGAVELRLATGDGIFRPLSKRQAELTRAESVTVQAGITIHFGYNQPEGNNTRAGLGGMAAIVHRDELYATRDGMTWVIEAPSFGISFGARYISVLVELPDSFAVRPEVYRQFLCFKDGDQRQVTLQDFSALVRTSIPSWMREIIAGFGPPQADYLNEVRDEIADLIMQLGITTQRSDVLRVRGIEVETSPLTNPSKQKLRYEDPPEIISLRDDAEIDERGLQARAARYYPDSHQLFINASYSAIARIKTQLCLEFESFPDEDRTAILAAKIAEWLVTRMVARALVYTLGKRELGWTREETARAQSMESFSVVADDYATQLSAARRRMAESLGVTSPEYGDGMLPQAAWIQRMAGDLIDAQQAARRAMTTPTINAAPILRRVSDIEMKRGNIEAAIQWAERALEAAPDDPVLHNQMSYLLLREGNLSAAEQAAQRALELTADRPASALRQLANIAQRRKDQNAALAFAQQAVDTDPADPVSLGVLAALLEEVGDYQTAEAILNQAIALSNEPARYYQQLSGIALKRRDIPAALDLAAKAVDADPRDIWTLNHFATVSLRAGDLDSAERAVRSALAIGGANPATFLRQLSRIETARKNDKAALHAAEEAVVAAPCDGWMRSHLASVLLQMGNPDRAEAELRHALELTPHRRSPILRMLAAVEQKRGNMPGAATLAQESVEADSNDHQSLALLAYYLIQIGQLDEAETVVHRALGLDVMERARYLRLLSDIAHRRQDIECAIDYGEQALKADEKDFWLYHWLSGLLIQGDRLDRAAEIAKRALDLPGVDRSTIERRLSEILEHHEKMAAAG